MVRLIERQLYLCPVFRVCRAYGVQLVVMEATKTTYRRCQVGEWCFGDEGTGYSRRHRRVVVASDHEYWQDDDAEVLHELAHLVCAIPKMRHNLPEEFMLLQWEESLVDRFRFDRKRFDFYRSTTVLPSFGKKLWKQLDQPMRQPWWKEGQLRAQRVGLLDAHNRATLKWPDWTKLNSADHAWLKHWQEQGWG